MYFATAASLDDDQKKYLRQLHAAHVANVEMSQFRDDLDNLPTTEEKE